MSADASTGAIRRRLAVLVALLVAGVGVLVFAPWKNWLLTGLEAARGLGPLGALAFVLVYALASVLVLPGSLLTLAAGFTWGLGWARW